MQHDRHVGGVEQADWVGAAHATLARGFDWDLDPEALEVDNGGKDGDGSKEVHDVRQVLSVESLLKSASLVWPSDEQMKQSDDCAFKFSTSSSVDCGWGKCLPNDGLADVCRNEQGDTRSKTISLL